MTRFARAKGSKASNERVAEEATSWHEMKQQLLEKKKERAEKEARNEANQNRLNNYKKFLEEQKEKSDTLEWTEFPENNNTKTKNKVKKNSTKKETKVPETEKKDTNNTDETDKNVSGNTTEHKIVEKKKRKKLQQTENSKKFKIENTTQENTSETSKPLKIPLEELSEKERLLVEKKKQRRLRQLEKRRKIREEKLAQRETDRSNNEIKNNIETTDNLNSKPHFKTQKNTHPQKTPKKKKIKDKNNTDFARRKPDKPTRITVNGKDIDLAYFDGFPIKKEDHERLKTLRKQMISKGLPRSEINNALKLERRRAEKALAREKKKVCFNCRKTGHNLSECPELNNEGQFVETNASGICFKCGSTEHTHFECKVVRGEEFKFAKCFVCNEQGHIARQCPDNARGLYPKGGACKLCGDVTHFKKDCPKMQEEKEKDNFLVETIDDGNIESLEGTNNKNNVNRGGFNKPKHIKF